MKNTIMISILIIAVLLSGCALQQSVNDEGADEETTKRVNPQNLPPESKVERHSVYDEPEYAEPDAEEAEYEPDIRRYDDDEGETVTLQKLEDTRRDKGANEVCDLDYPVTCSKFYASNGVAYLTLKNGYQSKINDVELTLDGEICDPSGSYIEPGQVKEFECYVDRNLDMVSGQLHMEYYSVIGQNHQAKTGQLVVKME